jgi:hypothetical protein
MQTRRLPSWLRTWRPLPSKASRTLTAKTSDMRSRASPDVSHSTAVDSQDMRLVPAVGSQRKTRATTPSFMFL